MGRRSARSLLVLLTLVCIIGLVRLETLSAQARPGETFASKVDAVFARWDSTFTPGCAVGVSDAGRIVLERAYGMADLEHLAVNRPDTIFEAGSVSKQFTAAAVLLLAGEGKLALDDPARKYVPELPDYGVPLTIRHMLQHVSGLRDWGTIEELAGWPRTTRAYTHAHVLDIVSRQRALNFTPGTDWSYSNTGYNLAAIIVSRVAGEPFAEFTRKRIFEPLGMTRTSWRDDFTRVVPDRAVAYADRSGGFTTDMPFENVHGNGGLLTTVGDLLRWNENFVTMTVGGAGLVKLQQTPGTFNDGREHDYGFGLFIREYRGLREVSHSGSTAGYRAHLLRFPDAHVSISVLCNVTSGNASRFAYQVADAYLGDRLAPVTRPASVPVPADVLAARAGLYRSLKTGEPLRVTVQEGSLVIRGSALVALSATNFRQGATEITFDGDGAGRSNQVRFAFPNGTSEQYARIDPWTPTAAELAAYAGTYTSDEVEVSLTLSVEDGALVVKRRPDTRATLEPVYADGFESPLGLIRFNRDTGGRVTSLSVVTGRAWDVRFDRAAGGR
jgi:CubicO group peptidase (beta-lactamase class C family)